MHSENIQSKPEMWRHKLFRGSGGDGGGVKIQCLGKRRKHMATWTEALLCISWDCCRCEDWQLWASVGSSSLLQARGSLEIEGYLKAGLEVPKGCRWPVGQSLSITSVLLNEFCVVWDTLVFGGNTWLFNYMQLTNHLGCFLIASVHGMPNICP